MELNVKVKFILRFSVNWCTAGVCACLASPSPSPNTHTHTHPLIHSFTHSHFPINPICFTHDRCWLSNTMVDQWRALLQSDVLIFCICRNCGKFAVCTMIEMDTQRRQSDCTFDVDDDAKWMRKFADGIYFRVEMLPRQSIWPPSRHRVPSRSRTLQTTRIRPNSRWRRANRNTHAHRKKCVLKWTKTGRMCHSASTIWLMVMARIQFQFNGKPKHTHNAKCFVVDLAALFAIHASYAMLCVFQIGTNARKFMHKNSHKSERVIFLSLSLFSLFVWQHDVINSHKHRTHKRRKNKDVS